MALNRILAGVEGHNKRVLAPLVEVCVSVCLCAVVVLLFRLGAFLHPRQTMAFCI
jgi:hypothetical protein